MLAFVINLISSAVFTGALAWGFSWLLARAGAFVRFKGAFPELVQNVAGTRARKQLRAQERDILLFTAAASATFIAAGLFCLYGTPRLLGLWMWLVFSLACLLFIAWWVFLVRGVLRWRELRFAARAQAAFAATLDRLAMQGHRVFHDVPVEGTVLDHVVMGSRGVFVVRMVARRPRRGVETVVRINGRSIEFQDGHALLDTIALAERDARALVGLAVKGLSHRPHAQSVVAVPGWEIAPAQNQAGETFLANEKTAVMLVRASKPAHYLMDADAALLHEHLARICIDPSL